jgi:hypothetical protein
VLLKVFSAHTRDGNVATFNLGVKDGARRVDAGTQAATANTLLMN